MYAAKIKTFRAQCMWSHMSFKSSRRTMQWTTPRKSNRPCRITEISNRWSLVGAETSDRFNRLDRNESRNFSPRNCVKMKRTTFFREKRFATADGINFEYSIIYMLFFGRRYSCNFTRSMRHVNEISAIFSGSWRRCQYSQDKSLEEEITTRVRTRIFRNPLTKKDLLK